MSTHQQAALVVFLFLTLFSSGNLEAADTVTPKKPSTTTYEIPTWFNSTFLNLREDLDAARLRKKRLMVYFGQDGCPYCRELMQNNFGQKDIVDFTRQHFEVVAINLWGDTSVTNLDGRSMTEKELGQHLKISYTPTLLFFDEQGNTVLRLNGYYPPHQFRAALQYASATHPNKETFRDYLARLAPAKSSGKIHSGPLFLKPPYDLTAKDNKPLLILFEQKDCQQCDTLHARILSLAESKAQIQRFNAVILDMWSNTPLVTPQGKRTTARDWARELNIIYAPSAVFFDKGKEIIRTEAMVKSFHMQSVMDYVSSRAYLTQSNLQRYIDERATRERSKGKTLDIWQ